jgi:hypothetical protein
MSENISIDKIKNLPVFFIIGRERSGTTLLRMLFDAHPNVNIQIEFHFISIMFTKYCNITYWTATKINEFYNDIVRLPRIHLLTIDKEKLKADLLLCAGPGNFSTLCRVVLFNYISFFKKGEIVLLGDKCPYYSLICDVLLRIFPEARFVHLVRDYRDNILSMLNVNIETKFFSSLAYRWKYYNKRIEKSKRKTPESFYTIRYEDLVTEPVKYLKEICNFLGITYDKSMPEFYKMKDEILKIYPANALTMVHRNLMNKINNEHIFSWEKKMTEKQIKKAEVIAGNFAERYSYIRKYKRTNFLLLLKSIPALIYGRIYFYFSLFIFNLPLNIKLKMLYILAHIFRKNWVKFKRIDISK